MKLSETIKAIRQQHQLSQSQMADRLSCKKSYISKLENEKSDYPPSTRFLQRLSKEFGLDFQVLQLQCGRIPAEMREEVVKRLLNGAICGPGDEASGADRTE